MQWERAKTYLIIFFIILNIGLFGLILFEERRYTMTQEQERTIRAVLAANNINVYTTLRRFPPMQPLEVSGFYYDIEQLLAIFFENPEQVPRDPFGDERPDDMLHYIFVHNNKRLEISNGFISFYNPYGMENPNNPALSNDNGTLNRDVARSMTNAFIQTYFRNFVEDQVFEIGSELRISYRQEYRGRIVQSNFIEFSISNTGITHIDMRFGRVMGHSGTTRMLYAPDEVLLTFMQRVSAIAVDTPFFISHMDLVYYQEYTSNLPDTSSLAFPFYRIFIQGNDMPFMINAFYNTILD